MMKKMVILFVVIQLALCSTDEILKYFVLPDVGSKNQCPDVNTIVVILCSIMPTTLVSPAILFSTSLKANMF